MDGSLTRFDAGRCVHPLHAAHDHPVAHRHEPEPRVDREQQVAGIHGLRAHRLHCGPHDRRPPAEVGHRRLREQDLADSGVKRHSHRNPFLALAFEAQFQRVLRRWKKARQSQPLHVVVAQPVAEAQRQNELVRGIPRCGPQRRSILGVEVAPHSPLRDHRNARYRPRQFVLAEEFEEHP